MENKFNLEEAMAGKPVQTRDGRAVTQLKFFEDVNINSIVGVVDKNIWSWNMKGQFNSLHGESDKDIFMAPQKKSVWVNVYERTEGGLLYVQSNFYSLESAQNHIAKGYSKFIKTIEITNEI